MNYVIKVSEEMGRGLYALHDIASQKFLFHAELLVLNEQDTIKVNETDLKYYTFKYNEVQDCIVLGDGEIFNHSDTPNVGYTLIDTDDGNRKLMMFYTLKDIKEGEQLFIDYNADTKVNTNSYKVNLY